MAFNEFPAYPSRLSEYIEMYALPTIINTLL